MTITDARLSELRARRRALIGLNVPTTAAPESARPRVPDPRQDEYLEDPLLRRMYTELESIGRLRSITVDLTHVCNIRCQGCYFFLESMDERPSPRDEAAFDEFIARELARGTNYMTVLGGEPSLRLDRLRKLHERFLITPFTNGIRRIPLEGFEAMPIAVSVWGDHATDTALRGGGTLDVFERALKNYRDDARATWYFTVTPGNAPEVERVTTQCVENGNYVFYSYYEDNSGLGGAFDHRAGFARVRRAVDDMIDRYPDRIISTSYLNRVATTNRLYDMTWGYDVCPTVSANYPKNAERLANGYRYNAHFRAYNPDLQTVRRCCVGEDRDCGNCYNVYARHTWIMINKALHMGSRQEFTNWLTSVFTFYLFIRAVDFEAGAPLLPEIHRRLVPVRDDVAAPAR